MKLIRSLLIVSKFSFWSERLQSERGPAEETELVLRDRPSAVGPARAWPQSQLTGRLLLLPSLVPLHGPKLLLRWAGLDTQEACRNRAVEGDTRHPTEVGSNPA